MAPMTASDDAATVSDPIKEEEADAPEEGTSAGKGGELPAACPRRAEIVSQAPKVSFDTLSMAFETESYTPGTMENPSPLVRHGM